MAVKTYTPLLSEVLKKVNNAKTKVRGGGAGSVPKSNSIPRTSM